MNEPWGPTPGPDQPPGPPPGPPLGPPPAEQHVHVHQGDDDGFFEELFDDDDHRRRDHHPRPRSGHTGSGGMGLREHVRSRYGKGIAVGDLLAWLDYRVNELHAALLEGERHPSRVPGSPVRMSGLDAVLNADAASFRAVTELGARLDSVEAKLDQVLSRLPERP